MAFLATLPLRANIKTTWDNIYTGVLCTLSTSETSSSMGNTIKGEGILEMFLPMLVAWGGEHQVQLWKWICWLITAQKWSNSRCNDHESETLSHSQLSKGQWGAEPWQSWVGTELAEGFWPVLLQHLCKGTQPRGWGFVLSLWMSCSKPFHFITINIHWAERQGNERWNREVKYLN